MRISMLPATKLMIDNTKVVFLSFIILLALIIPIIPAGIPINKIMPLPQMPTVSSNLYRELEFKTFVGVVDHQMTKGITMNSASSNQKIIFSNTVLFSFVSNTSLSNSYLSNRLYHLSASKSRRSLVYHQFRRNCISSTRSVASHQAAGGCTLTRDEIQGRQADLDDMHRTLCGDDIPSLWLG